MVVPVLSATLAVALGPTTTVVSLMPTLLRPGLTVSFVVPPPPPPGGAGSTPLTTATFWEVSRETQSVWFGPTVIRRGPELAGNVIGLVYWPAAVRRPRFCPANWATQ